MYLHMQAVLLCKWNTCLFRDGKVVSTCTVTWHETFLILLRSNMKHFTCRLKSFHQCVVMQYSNTIKKYIKYVRHIIDNIWIILIFFLSVHILEWVFHISLALFAILYWSFYWVCCTELWDCLLCSWYKQSCFRIWPKWGLSEVLCRVSSMSVCIEIQRWSTAFA